MVYYCSECEKWWNHSIKKCIFCGKDVQEIVETKYKVIGFTEVQVPSIENPKVPYFNYLLEDKNGNKIIIKSFLNYKIGEFIDLEESLTNKNLYKVGIIGTGQMGIGIAEYMLKNGHQTIIKTRSKTKTVFSKVKKKLSRELSEEQLSKIITHLTVTLDYSELKDCDIIIEAVTENLGIKKNVFEELSRNCIQETIFATNTSSISIDEIAINTDRPENVIGMHFFNPVSRMDLIEVIVGKKTSKNTTDRILSFSYELQKVPIIVKDSPGFIVNRLLLPQINEAVLLLEKDIAKKEDIDKAMKLGLNHPMGPFQLADFIGIDVCLSILKIMHKNIGDDKYKPANTLIKMVEIGKLGFKSGEGFYKY